MTWRWEVPQWSYRPNPSGGGYETQQEAVDAACEFLDTMTEFPDRYDIATEEEL